MRSQRQAQLTLDVLHQLGEAQGELEALRGADLQSALQSIVRPAVQPDPALRCNVATRGQ